MTAAYGNPEADTVLIQMVDAHSLEGMESEAAAIRQLTDIDFYLAAIKVHNWNAELSPWSAPAVFGKEDFGNGAADTLAGVLKYTEDKRKTYYLGGYSLAALFALWAAHQTDVFKGVAAASPSIWYPGFTDYMREHRIRSGLVYLSLGDREEKVRNPVMKTVGERIREAEKVLKAQGVNTRLEWNQGNHFKDTGIRTAKAFAWVLKNGNTVPVQQAQTC